jgi:hypothetical protein
MKKIYLLACLLILCISPQFSYGISENRLQWWEVRLEQAIADKAGARSKKELIPLVLPLFDNEIGRAEKLISLYESSSRNDGSLMYEQRAVTDLEVKSEIQKTVPSLFAVRFLEILVNEAGSAGVISAARVLALQGAAQLFKTISDRDSEELIAKTMKEEIGQSDWKIISREIFFNRMMQSRKPLLEQVKEGVYETVKLRLQPRNNVVSARDLRTLVIAAFVEYLREYDLLNNLTGSCEALEGSWSWKKKRAALEKRFAAYRDMPQMNDKEDAVRTTGDGRSDPASAGEFIDLYRYQLARELECLTFIRDLITEGAQMSLLDAPNLHQAFALSISRSVPLFKAAENSLSLEKKYQASMSKKELITIRELKAGFMGDLLSMKSEIKNRYREYARHKSAAERDFKKRQDGIKDKIAQHEIYALLEHAQECAGLYEKLCYAEDIFTRYVSQFASLMKEARTGSASPSLESAVSKDSLFPGIHGFDRDRMIVEYSTKKFLRDEAKTALSRLCTLLKHYKKKGVDIRDIPSRQDIAALEARTNRNSSVRIDAWTMNESNFSDIDKKAAHRLSLLIGRNANGSDLKKGVAEDAIPESRLPVTLLESGVSFVLPRGWEEATLGETDRYQGIVKSFHSNDNHSSLQLVKLRMENGDVKDISEQWIRKSGYSLIEKRWGKINEVEYLWILAKDRERNVIETCSVVKDGYALLISGKTSRERSAKFSEQFRFIIGSMQAGKI